MGRSETSIDILAPAFAGTHEPKPLPFEPARLVGLSERLIRSHWENNYCGALKVLNAVERRLGALLADPDVPPWTYGDLKREELLRTGSVRLHELYFGNLGGDGKPAGPAGKALADSFGSLGQWEDEFRRTASSLAGGSGWAILASGPGGELHNYWAWDHMHGAPGGELLLVLDMYEHAYHIDYGAAAARYVDAFMRTVDWEVVSQRLERATAPSRGGREADDRRNPR